MIITIIILIITFFYVQLAPETDMIDELKNYRGLTYLGHKSDIFTLTAEEAIKLCLPVVTFGIGSLKERVSTYGDRFYCKK